MFWRYLFYLGDGVDGRTIEHFVCNVLFIKRSLEFVPGFAGLKYLSN